ncbi:hypothetical protein [Smaragdicoccus niigatensis]|uniref:hypothetical protein n=1 Tax=Smaragdicoccus niigatensis TaxID=359359 RepID=UPI00036B230E|nr:hypothetical protein [Smaragdicoccus niigatensis]
MAPPETVIHLQTPASAQQLPVIRAVASTVGMSVDLDLDVISDIQLAIDEACTQLLRRCINGAVLHSTFEALGNGLRVTVAAAPVRSSVVRDKSFGWDILDTVTDSIELNVLDSAVLALWSSSDQPVGSISFTKLAPKK